MTTGRVWNESVFNSYANLRNFFAESDAIGQVLSRKDKICSKTLIPVNPNLDCKWKVCQVATAPFRWILAIVLKIASKVAELLGASAFSKQARKGARHLIEGFNIYTEDSTKLFKIKDSVNTPNEKGGIVNNTSSIPGSLIADPRVKKRTFCSSRQMVKFGHKEGICRGMSDWLIYLYLNTKDQFSDPRSHMRALGKQFADGGGMDPTLIQSLAIQKGKLLGLKIGSQRAHSPGGYTPIVAHTTTNWNSQAGQIAQELQNMPVGAYRAWVPQHATAYIKTNANLGFFFDPNHGITEINGDAQGEKLYELVSKSLKGTGELENEPLFNNVTFIPVTVR